MQHDTTHSCVEVFAETRHDPHGATRHAISAGSSPPARMGRNWYSANALDAAPDVSPSVPLAFEPGATGTCMRIPATSSRMPGTSTTPRLAPVAVTETPGAEGNALHCVQNHLLGNPAPPQFFSAYAGAFANAVFSPSTVTWPVASPCAMRI